ncbi:hypothetical protein DCMF_01800 [Candidatus Formimonas warabiya]|uniref:Uncharacterized protein n=1 Tax=Formimonas warabiya TaxID=1761012 RepID=A0A3G1KMK7_FORW1|nr:hypothetical protein DCMF_01800 [Candidatus Formimonas warabiya]
MGFLGDPEKEKDPEGINLRSKKEFQAICLVFLLFKEKISLFREHFLIFLVKRMIGKTGPEK